MQKITYIKTCREKKIGKAPPHNNSLLNAARNENRFYCQRVDTDRRSRVLIKATAMIGACEIDNYADAGGLQYEKNKRPLNVDDNPSQS